MPVEPAVELAAVLEQEEHGEHGEREPERERRDALDAVDDTVREGRERARRGTLRTGLGLGRARRVDAEALQPGGDLVEAFRERGGDLTRLRDQPAEHEHDDDTGEGDQREQHDARGQPAPDAVAAEHRDDGRRDGRDDRADDDGHDDRRGLPQHPADSRNEERGSEQEPRRHAEVTQPLLGRKDGRRAGEVAGAQWARRVVGLAAAIVGRRLGVPRCRNAD